MGCFGDMEATKQVATTSSSTTAPPAWVQEAGQQNYNQARGVLDQGFVPYTGNMIAPLSSDEIAAGNLVRNTAATPNPYLPQTESNLTQYGAAPATQYDWSKVTDPNGPLGPMSDYMSPYLQEVLAPMLRQIGISGAQQRQGIDRSATMSGAFGDARHGVVESEQRKNQMLQEGDTTGKVYADAFTQAMGNRQQDLSRKLTTDQAQNTANESRLARMRQSGIDLTSLDQSGVARALGLAGAEGQAGSVARGVEQAKNTSDYGQFMREQGFTDQQIAFLTQILSGTPTAKTTTGEQMQTTSQPNNSGWQALGAGASAAAPEIASMAAMLFL